MAIRESDFYCALYDVARAITSTLNLNEVLQKIVESTANAMQAKACTLRLLSNDRQRLVPGAMYGLSEGYMRKGVVEIDKSGVDREAMGGAPVYIADVAEDARFQYPEQAREEGICSVLVVPVDARGKTIGVMRIYTAERREFSDKEIEFVSLIADLSALAIDNARLYQATKEDYEVLVDFKDRLFPL
jgi:signal transduction protein with GAF and PtsI domain